MPSRSARPPRTAGARPRAVSAARPSPASAGTADRLHSAAIHLLRWLRREDDRSGLSAPRFSALSVIVFAGPVTLGEMAAAEQVRPPTMTRLVQALEAEGLVSRHTDPRDARVTRLLPTPKGRRLLAAGRRRRVAALGRRLTALEAGDRTTLDRAARLIENLVSAARRRDA